MNKNTEMKNAKIKNGNMRIMCKRKVLLQN